MMKTAKHWKLPECSIVTKRRNERMKEKKYWPAHCEKCLYYTEELLGAGKLKGTWRSGYCTCKYELARGINGRKLTKPLPYREVWRTWSCKSWIDRESGMTRYEALTGKKEEKR